MAHGAPRPGAGVLGGVTVQIERHQPDLFRSRLQKLIDHTRENVLYGAWNDDGRLLEAENAPVSG